MYISAEYMTSKDAGCELHVQYSYCIAGNFRDQRPARENLFPRKFIPPEIFCWRAEDAKQSVFEPQIQ